MYSVFVAGVFLALLLAPCLLAMQFRSPEKTGTAAVHSEFANVRSWKLVARSQVDRHPVIARLLSATTFPAHTSRNGKWRTS